MYHLKKSNDQTQLAYLNSDYPSEFGDSLTLKVALDENFQFFPYNHVFGNDPVADQQAESMLRNSGSKSSSVKQIRDVFEKDPSSGQLVQINQDQWKSWGFDEEDYDKAMHFFDKKEYEGFTYDLDTVGLELEYS